MKLIIVTGANRGFGQALVNEILKGSLIDCETKIVMLNRTMAGIANFEQIFKETGNANVVEFIEIECNLMLEQQFRFLESLGDNFDRVLLFNNAGTLGKLDHISELKYKDISTTININLVGVMALTSKFLGIYGDATIVNISSLAAIQPFETWGLYSSCKAALDMFHATIALEMPRSKILNYAPGPLDTRMQQEIRETMPDIGLKQVYIDMHLSEKLVAPSDSAVQLLKLIQNQNFKSGAHIDYYDI